MSLARFLRRFARAKKGTAAVEFAIIAPLIMVPLLLSSVELIDALGVDARAQNAAASLADVVARDTSVSDAEVEGYWDALEVLMYPNSTDNVDVRITSIRIIDSSTAEVVWSEVKGGGMTPMQAGSRVTNLDERMMIPGTSIIMADSTYTYDSPVKFLFENGATFRHTAYRRARMVDPIVRE